ncbi:hypothetical protein BDZ89DRAFT_1057258 [Hymenopellis radicata]|nr:hypothetical protein BDZ89DRAFT_1057258 [Hymenopellis radicata]
MFSQEEDLATIGNSSAIGDAGFFAYLGSSALALSGNTICNAAPLYPPSRTAIPQTPSRQ